MRRLSESPAMAPDDVRFPLADAQKALLLSEARFPGSTNMVVEIRLAADYAQREVLNTVRELFAVHGALTTRVHRRSLEQVVGPPERAQIALLGTQEPSAIAQIGSAAQSEPFDFESHVARALVCRDCTDGSWVVFVVVSHMVTDAWSNALIRRDVARLLEDRTAERPNSRTAYGEWVVAQESVLADPAVIASAVDRLRNFPSVFWPSPPHGSLVSDAADVTPESLKKLRDLRLTPFMFAVGRYVEGLLRATGWASCPFRMPVANRTDPKSFDVVGLFANVVLATLEDTQPVAVRNAIGAALATQGVPLARILPRVRRPDRDPLLVRNGAAAVVVRSSSLPARVRHAARPAVRRSSSVAKDHGFKYDMLLDVIAGPHGMRLNLSYREGLSEIARHVWASFGVVPG